MNYCLVGHQNRYAVEEILYNLLPFEKHRAVTSPKDTCMISQLKTNGTVSVVTASFSHSGKVEGQYDISISCCGLSPQREKSELSWAIKESIYQVLVPTYCEKPEWGALTGVRPAKMARLLMERGKNVWETEKILQKRFHISQSRAKLTMCAAQFAKEIKEGLNPKDISLYISIPFCPTRCHYCSFVSHSITKANLLLPQYLDKLYCEMRDLAEVLRNTGKKIISVYIGGGTPTILDEMQLQALCTALYQHFDLRHMIEFTVEAGRADTITEEKLAILKRYGVTRISINPQTMQDAVLRASGRQHTVQQFMHAWNAAQLFRFDCINTDLIAGLPKDTLEGFRASVDDILRLSPENITIHTLAVKNGADLSDRQHNFQNREMVGKMLHYAYTQLQMAGYVPYYLYRQKFMAGNFENTGWSKPGKECRYNVYMMEEMQSILSVGAAGTSKFCDVKSGKIQRIAGTKYPYEYCLNTDHFQKIIQKLQEETDSALTC